ncbi:hypothetical protein [Oceaniovalibus sp. ACAM 378]|nr:hypothetical protein [Oceaniovalibus sp. ACAM 378]
MGNVAGNLAHRRHQRLGNPVHVTTDTGKGIPADAAALISGVAQSR